MTYHNRPPHTIPERPNKKRISCSNILGPRHYFNKASNAKGEQPEGRHQGEEIIKVGRTVTCHYRHYIKCYRSTPRPHFYALTG